MGYISITLLFVVFFVIVVILAINKHVTFNTVNKRTYVIVDSKRRLGERTYFNGKDGPERAFISLQEKYTTAVNQNPIRVVRLNNYSAWMSKAIYRVRVTLKMFESYKHTILKQIHCCWLSIVTEFVRRLIFMKIVKGGNGYVKA